MLVTHCHHLFELILLDLHHRQRLSEEALEIHDVLLVVRKGRAILVLINVEVEAILLQNLHGVQFFEGAKHLLDVALFSCEKLEFFGASNILVFTAFFHEALEKGAAFLDELVIVVANQSLLRNRRNIDTWPSLGESDSQCIELSISSLLLEGALCVHTSNSVLDMASDLNWIFDGKLSELGVFINVTRSIFELRNIFDLHLLHVGNERMRLVILFSVRCVILVILIVLLLLLLRLI